MAAVFLQTLLMARQTAVNRWAIILLAAVAVTGGCAGRPDGHGDLSPQTRAAIYSRAEQFFTAAILLKPGAGVAETNPAFALAPLFLQEVAGSNSIAGPRRVYFEAGQVTLRGKGHRQMTYVWNFPPAGASGPEMISRGQGVRLTLDARDRPVIWEVLNDPSGARIIYVSQSLEAAAAQTHGEVLPGRRHAVEPDLTSAPGVIVARVIEDGPEAMGPMVHLGARAGEVVTLICRCMPVQTRAVVATGNYELRPLPAGGGRISGRIDSGLRLPPDF